jgi:DNA-binding MurR/RpiR family transcriptional regulator
VSLTSNPESPLGKLSDEILVAAANDSSVSGRLSEIRLSQMILADTLCSYILSMMDDSNRGRYLELSSVLKTYSVED